MDRALNALVNLDVPADIVRIDVRGSLTQGSRPELAHIIRRIRRMGIRSHIRVYLSGAVLVESSALAGLRSDLNAIDTGTLPGIYGSGVSLDLTLGTAEWAAGQEPSGRELALIEGLADGCDGVGDLADGFPLVPAGRLDDLCGRPLEEYSDAELLTASDSIFALLDSPKAFAGSDLLGRYNDIGEELRRRQQESAASLPASEGQAAS
ncbi:hypothetical protein FHJ30_02725 [Arthrobacter sp. BB-1]|uniref:hypothetical protein n=1 Tax=unclassified Arthrobacter TaxID=235627 RepID=UPI0011122EC5|nr:MULTISPECIES: hypothetical protein [unclassified Arthrobacter]TNB76304.1 hypothetical protein FHJ30_02725 [Arthrobacter sp. BB-1]